ncbi:hypothetical protein M885DRAFT_622974 [Pelagophyceae sp. CCMP2097]|nr:hypothetical protein M885DRAFT_622974 [Pelagophyceae sp. CCMP2097]
MRIWLLANYAQRAGESPLMIDLRAKVTPFGHAVGAAQFGQITFYQQHLAPLMELASTRVDWTETVTQQCEALMRTFSGRPPLASTCGSNALSVKRPPASKPRKAADKRLQDLEAAVPPPPHAEIFDPAFMAVLRNAGEETRVRKAAWAQGQNYLFNNDEDPEAAALTSAQKFLCATAASEASAKGVKTRDMEAAVDLVTFPWPFSYANARDTATAQPSAFDAIRAVLLAATPADFPPEIAQTAADVLCKLDDGSLLAEFYADEHRTWVTLGDDDDDDDDEGCAVNEDHRVAEPELAPPASAEEGAPPPPIRKSNRERQPSKVISM